MYTKKSKDIRRAEQRERERKRRTVGERVDLRVLALGAVDTAEACKRVLAIDVHRTRAANALAARAAEGKRRVDLVLDLDQRVEDHGPTLVQVNLVRLQNRLLRGLVGVLHEEMSNCTKHGYVGEAE
jgi:hypothetical protein